MKHLNAVRTNPNSNAIQYSRMPLWKQYSLVFISLMWGSFSSFAAIHPTPTILQSTGLFIAFFGTVLLYPDILLAWARSKCGLLILLYAAVAIFSGALNGSKFADIMRYFAVFPAIAIMYGLVLNGKKAVEMFRLGLTLSGVAFVWFHFVHLEFSQIVRASYRLFVFLNPNGVGFISAVTGVSLAGYILKLRPFSFLSNTCWLSFAACIIVCFATKSRTASIVFLAGGLVLLSARLSWKWILGIAFISIFSILLMDQDSSSTSSTSHLISRSYRLNDKGRTLETATGRSDIWKYVLFNIFPKYPFIGVGPGKHYNLIETYIGHSSAHNGLLMNLAEIGIFGTTPIIIILLICLKSVYIHQNVRKQVLTAIFTCAVVESITEIMFFSIGNTASLLFLLSVAYLTGGSREPLLDT